MSWKIFRIKDKRLILQRYEWILPSDPLWNLFIVENKSKIQSVSLLLYTIIET